jgi:diguanylate cyclase (GGDEF)-like protein
MVDVDHFKQVNDQHGHGVGDLVLERLARLMRSYVRPSDVLARFGGEEFTLLLPGLDAPSARDVCERLRQGIEQHDWSACGLPAAHGVTASMGVGVVEPGSLAVWPCDLAALVAPADEALYEAKRRGRNRVEMG